MHGNMGSRPKLGMADFSEKKEMEANRRMQSCNFLLLCGPFWWPRSLGWQRAIFTHPWEDFLRSVAKCILRWPKQAGLVSWAQPNGGPKMLGRAKLADNGKTPGEHEPQANPEVLLVLLLSDPIGLNIFLMKWPSGENEVPSKSYGQHPSVREMMFLSMPINFCVTESVIKTNPLSKNWEILTILGLYKFKYELFHKHIWLNKEWKWQLLLFCFYCFTWIKLRVAGNSNCSGFPLIWLKWAYREVTCFSALAAGVVKARRKRESELKYHINYSTFSSFW